jgi:hypothetical protein
LAVRLVTLMCSMALVLSVEGAAGVQSQPKPGAQAEAQPQDNSDAENDRREHLTAEDVLKALQKQRPENRVIPPASAPEWTGETVRGALFPEGSAVVNRTGSLFHDGLWWMFVFDDDPDMPAMKLLPNSTLEPMVRTVEGTDAPLRFEVSGELTVFGEENYLLPKVAMRSTEVASAPKDSQHPDEAGRVEPAESSPPSGGLEASPEDVLKRLQAERPSQEALSMALPVADAAPDDTPEAARTLVPDGTPLVERVGRIIRRGDWWTFVFESDHPDHPEPPMRVLPSNSLEQMVQAADFGINGLVFILSGQVTVFEKENYLLPRIARQRIDAGNLRK